MKKKFILIAAGVIFIFFSLYFIFRQSFAENIIEEKVTGFNRNHEAKVYLNDFRFRGIKTLYFDEIALTSADNDTLITINNLSAGLRVFPMFIGNVRLSKLKANKIEMNLKHEKLKTYYTSFSSKPVINSTSKNIAGDNFDHTVARLLRHVFNMVPKKVIVGQLLASYKRDTIQVTLGTKDLLVNRGRFDVPVYFLIKDSAQHARISGHIKSRERSLDININPGDQSKVVNSPLAILMGGNMSYESLIVTFREKGIRGKKLNLQANYSIQHINLHHTALSSKNISFPGYQMNLNLSVGKNFIEIDSTSTLSLGTIDMNPFLRYRFGNADSIYFTYSIPDFPVADFYSSIPDELFPHLKNIKATGQMGYRMKFIIDLKQPDSLFISSNFESRELKITSIDHELKKMGGNFIYVAHEKGLPVRTIEVSPGNPDFVPIDEIPLVLQQSILTAEDGSFYSHEGFLISAIRRAIAENIKAGKLYRGGSTITQQLIKNVYLSHEKTITRKLEEVMLVWLIEHNNLVSKHRMFEVYMNIIEWGPGVYGVKEAADFYFRKHPLQLKPEECIFLASVIPSPKKFYYRFDKAGALETYMIEYYRDLSGKLQHKGILTTSNGDSLAAKLNISGRAKDYIRIKPEVVDTLE